jgi:hypothetical protein
MKKLLSLISVITLFFASACSTIEDGSTQKLALELVTKVATSEALQGDKEKAETVVEITDFILTALDTGEITTPVQVDEAIRNVVLGADLQPGSKQAILVLTDSIKTHYLKRIDLGQIDPNTTAPLRDILTWVNQAANDTLRYGAVDTYGVPPIASNEIDESLWGWLTSNETRKANPLKLKEPYQQTLDPKWYDGVQWMLDNPTDQ